MGSHYKKVSAAGLLVALGIIYGDIGTSPLYTFQTILTDGGGVNKGLVFGAIFCIFWTLTLQTTFKGRNFFLSLGEQFENLIIFTMFSRFAILKYHSKLGSESNPNQRIRPLPGNN